MHLVQAYAHEAGLVLASCATSARSNEITAIPDLLALIDVHGAIVTLDAMGTQKAIADKIIKGGGDYVLALKGNQGTLHDDVARWFADPALALQGVSGILCAGPYETVGKDIICPSRKSHWINCLRPGPEGTARP